MPPTPYARYAMLTEREKTMKCRKITACLLALLMTCSAVASCTGGGTSDVTATGTDTGSATESVTVVETDRATDTEHGSESESETAPIPAVKENVPTSGASVTFYHNENNSLFLTAEGLDAAVTEDAEVGTVLSLRAAGGSEHTLTLNYGEYVRAHGLEPATVGGTQYVILRFRVENGDAASLRLGTATEAGATSRPLAGAYDPADAGWQSVLYAVGNFKWAGKPSDGDAFAGITLSLFRSAPAQGETVHLYSVTLTSDLPTALAALGYTDQLLGGGDTSGVVWNDPVRHVRLTAPDEDESVALWFDHVTEKTLQTTVTPTDKAGYTVRLARNEIEDCQFFLAPATDRTFRLELSPMTNEAGKMLETSLLYTVYHDVAGERMPDAIPPVSAPIAVRGGQSQGFVVKVKSTAESEAGLYRAELKVFDEETGRQIKAAYVYAYVWDFTLSDKTEMRTAMQMLYWRIYRTYPEGTDTEKLAINYYEFLLDNRINAMALPFGVREERVWKYMDNPRVNSFWIPGVDEDRHAEYTASVYEILGRVEGRREKAFFYRVDEPTTPEMLNKLAKVAASIAPYYKEYHMVTPCYVNIDLSDGRDQIEFMKDYVDIWCHKMNAFTPRWLEFAKGAQYVQTAAQDKKYGEYADRIAAEVAGGDQSWTYFCFEPTAPYVNWMANGDGTEPIVSFWQCKLLGIQGVLFWGVNEWRDNMYDLYEPATNSWGDGILIYSGAPFGIDTPVSSLRLETIRDGIEDYQYLCMLEQAAGKQAVDELVRLVTTNVLVYTSDDDYLAAVRVLLGDRLEQALKG